MKKRNNALIIVSTVLYSMIWFAMLFIIIGLFMIKPVAFYHKISGGYSYHPSKTSKYGYSDDPTEDEAMFIDDMDEN